PHQLMIRQSTDYGNTWSFMKASHGGSIPLIDSMDIVVDYVDPNYIYVGFCHWNRYEKSPDGSTIWVSDDGGKNILYTHDSGTDVIYAMAGDPENTSQVYVSFLFPDGDFDRVIKTINKGGTFFFSGTNLPNQVTDILVDPKNTDNLYVGSCSGYKGVWKSANQGGSWYQVGLNIISVYALAVDYDYDFIYAGCDESNGIYKTTDGGNIWIQMNDGLDYKYIRDLEIDPEEPTIIYTICRENNGAIHNFVYCSVDRGGKWFNLSEGLTVQQLHKLRIDSHPNQPKTVYLGTEHGIYTYTPEFNKSLVSSSNEATFKNNGRKICRIIGSDELWVTYESGGVVYAVRSTDAVWSKKMELGQGYNPCISVNPTMVADHKPGVVWRAQGDRDTLYFARYISDNNWTSPIVIVTSQPGVNFGPPSFVIGTDNIGRLVYTAAEHPYRVYYTQFDIYDPVVSDPELVGTGENPSIEFMPGIVNPHIHVVWENNSTVLYRSRTIGGTWSDQETVFTNSNHPCLEIDGTNVYVVCEAFSDIYYRYAVYSGGNHYWTRYQKISHSDVPSTYPVLTGGNTCAWVEEIPGNFEIYFSYYDPEIGWVEPINISNTDECSNYPHITHKQTIERTIVYFTWTESNSAPYDIKFQTYSFGLGEGGSEALPFYVANGGEEEASPFNLRREGYHQYGTEPYKQIDYDQEYLEYQFEGLNPEREYAGAVYLYQHGYANLPILAKVDNYQIGAITLPSDTLIILKHMVPTMLYEDSIINIKIFGNNAVSAILVLYEYEVDSAGGGPQSSQSMLTQTGHLTLSVYPNPVKKFIGIEYNLPAKTDIKLSIFDVAGRLIKNIVSENQESGIFHKSFDITNLSQGVYFIRLNTRDKSLVEKVIFLK
ncbi:T9SS type A sorting domain-containing protein, partial [candidate division WOR-3 bacterium]|nr:T9SS type A sorting domain-containing protein [candidate division WOR-3 bacterium]